MGSFVTQARLRGRMTAVSMRIFRSTRAMKLMTMNISTKTSRYALKSLLKNLNRISRLTERTTHLTQPPHLHPIRSQQTTLQTPGKEVEVMRASRSRFLVVKTLQAPSLHAEALGSGAKIYLIR